MADGKTALIVGGTLLGVLALVAWASPGESSIQVNRPPAPPPPGPTPQGTDAAVAAAIAAAQAAFNTSPGAPMQPPPPQAANGQMSGQLLPNPAPLQQGRRYRSRLELGALEASLATPERIRSQFETLGFSNVVVYTAPSQVSPGWPQQAFANVTNRSRWVEGTWSEPSQMVAKPSQIQNAWIA